MLWYKHIYVSGHTVHMVTRLRNASDVVAHLESQIATGRLAPGDRLAPVRALAEQLGLAPNTVAGAYRMLRQRGYTISRGRKGTFVAQRPALGVFAEDAVPAGLVDLANGQPDPALLPDIRKAISKMSYRPATYATEPVDPGLADMFRDDLAADGVDPTHLTAVGGALDGIERVLAAHLRIGDAVAVEDPAYASVLDLLAAMGLRPIPMTMDQEGPLPSACLSTLAAGATAMIVTPRAHNPTGAAISAPRRSELRAAIVGFPELLLIEDDHAGSVAGADHHPIVRPDMRHWAVLRSVSKSLGPDLRLAAVAGDATTIGRVGGRQAVGTGWISHVLQRIVVELRTDSDELLQQAAATYTHRRAVFVETLAALGVVGLSASGLNVWVPVADEAAVVTAMQHRGYAIRAGSRFRIRTAPGVRVTIASSSGDQLCGAATALADVLTTGSVRRTG